QHQPGQGRSVDVRARSRLGARHRGPGHREPGRAGLDRRDDARASRPSGRRARGGRRDRAPGGGRQDRDAGSRWQGLDGRGRPGLRVARVTSFVNEPPIERAARVEARVRAVLDGLGVPYEWIGIDPAYADTAAFCERYGYGLETAANTIVVAAKKDPRQY